MSKGELIIVDGPDFAGKTTVIKHLEQLLKKQEKKVITTFEPGSNIVEKRHYSLCNEIRKQLLTKKHDDNAEALLFAMSRYFHTLDIVEYLKDGYYVICDRYFLSSLAYQGHKIGGHSVYSYNKPALDLLDDYKVHNIVLTLDIDTYKERASKRDKDAMEDVSEEEIKIRLNNVIHADIGLDMLGMSKWAYDLRFVDGTNSKEEVLKEVQTIINNIIG